MLTTYCFNFRIGQVVFIKPLGNQEGSVIAIFLRKEEVTYQVRYFHNNQCNEVYFHDHELLDFPDRKDLSAWRYYPNALIRL